MIEGSKVERIAFIGTYLPRKCGIATFTSDPLTAVAAERPSSECFSVSMNEELLADGNGVLVRFGSATILTGRATGQKAVLDRGVEAPRRLVHLQTAENGYFRPIGSNGFFRRGGIHANFDQQPVQDIVTSFKAPIAMES